MTDDGYGTAHAGRASPNWAHAEAVEDSSGLSVRKHFFVWYVGIPFC